MPVVFRSDPYVFWFYSDEGTEPIHIHVRRDDARAKFWVDPVVLSRSHGFGDVELRRIERLVVEHQALLIESRHEHFNR